MAVSPDGSGLVFVAISPDGRSKLWLRRFAAVDSRPIDGSEDGRDPFWSPDGRWIAFFAHNKLKRIAASGGVPQDICDVPIFSGGGTWNRDGTILFGGFGESVGRVSDTGGVPTQLTALAAPRSGRFHRWPVFLPDGRHFLYLAVSDNAEQTAIYQGTLDSNETHRVFAADSGVATAGGYVITLSKGLLSARAYDVGRQQTGPPITIAEGIVYDPPQRSGPVFAAAAGVVAFRSASPDSRLTWFDRSGRDLGSFPVRADYHHPWLSPDEKRIAVEKTDPATGRHTIWILDWSRGTSSRLLPDPSGAHAPMWSSDGSRIAFGSNRGGSIDLYDIDADGASSPKLILASKVETVQVTDWSLDRRFVLYVTVRRGQRDLFVLPMSPPAAPQPFLETPADERQGQFSPDVHWIAYTSTESGSAEVYVRAYPDTGRKWQISTRGGAQPHWRRDGKELFYLAPDGKLIAVALNAGPARLDIGSPRELFDTGIRGSFLDRRNQFVVTRDGQRFLVNISAEDENPAPITVMMNWDAAR